MIQETSKTFPFPDFASSVPATDCATLEGLSKDEIRAWALRKSEEYRLLSYDMLSLHNAAAPIHILPVELLMKIFGMTWFMHDGKDRQGFRLPSVCRKWRTVYLSTPAFWAQAVAQLTFLEVDGQSSWKMSYYSGDGHPVCGTIQPSQKVVNMLLARSSHHPIMTLYAEHRPKGPADPSLPACVLPSAVFHYPYLNHLVSFNVNTTLRHLHDLHRVLTVGMPALEKLYISANGDEPVDLARTIATLPPVPDGNLPSLRFLHLSPAIFFPLVAVRSLEYLYLDSWPDMDDDSEVPWTHLAESESRSLIRALSRCYKLKSLHLEAYMRSRWWPPLGDGGSGTVQLPLLKRLSFGSDTETVEPCAHIVLAALDPCIPSTASVSRGPLMPGWPDNLSEVMPDYLVQHHPFDTVILSMLKKYFPGRQRSWAIYCLAGGSPRLEVRFGTSKPLAELGIEHVFRTTHVTHLEVIQDLFSDMDMSTTPDLTEDWAATLHAFPHLTHLTVCGVDTPGPVVDALGSDTGHSEFLASGRPLCPALRYVTVGWWVPREIGPKKLVRSSDPATYRQHQDVGPRVEQRCSSMQLAFERRTSMNAQALHALEFYEYETWGDDKYRGVAAEFGELISGSRRDDSDLACLGQLREVVGGPVVYRGYLLKTAVERQWNADI
ncbi:hypothetical protein GSI_04701 [Ganoderma sinense ZZ0214-1]|uniref:Uncharacterized protein n=1 Tax=Ganoderma sinense ZZ0214-1 TaxID=1077348 RepID=A0A2G8SHM8_9APHY|nr:hypothetical protein GSI_04701 [Ganoderma sinense ZZ0214-1]